jgi:hypothetical protein
MCGISMDSMHHVLSPLVLRALPYEIRRSTDHCLSHGSVGQYVPIQSSQRYTRCFMDWDLDIPSSVAGLAVLETVMRNMFGLCLIVWLYDLNLSFLIAAANMNGLD